MLVPQPSSLASGRISILVTADRRIAKGIGLLGTRNVVDARLLQECAVAGAVARDLVIDVVARHIHAGIGACVGVAAPRWTFLKTEILAGNAGVIVETGLRVVIDLAEIAVAAVAGCQLSAGLKMALLVIAPVTACVGGTGDFGSVVGARHKSVLGLANARRRYHTVGLGLAILLGLEDGAGNKLSLVPAAIALVPDAVRAGAAGASRLVSVAVGELAGVV